MLSYALIFKLIFTWGIFCLFSQCTYEKYLDFPGDDLAWKRETIHELKVLGAKNWIIIAEPSFSAINGPGVKTIITEEPGEKVTLFVLDALEQLGHTSPRIKIPMEFFYVSEEYAPGILDYRKKLSRILLGREPQELQNDTLNKIVMDIAKEYNILVIKTATPLPFSNLYIELDSGYWNTESQTDLIRSIEKNPPLTPPTQPIPTS